jgi:hypothetical protein
MRLIKIGATATATALLGVTLAACSGGSDSSKQATASFNNQGGDRTQNCLVHQTAMPTSDYTGGSAADTAHVLAVLRYYKANSGKPFCDGKAASKIDKVWMNWTSEMGVAPVSVGAK